MLNNFKPTVWRTDLLKKAEVSQVLIGLTNRQYEGDIKNAGDQVKLLTVNDVTVKDYSPYTDLEFEKLSGADLYLKVDKQKYFGITIDDLDKVQSNYNLMDATTSKAARSMTNIADQDIASTYSEFANEIVETAFDSSKVFSLLSRITRIFAEQNIPESESKYLVVSPWVAEKFKLAKIEFDTNNSEVIRTGMLGSLWGLDIYVSNNLVTSGTDANPTAHCLAGTYDAIAFVQQILKLEAGRFEKRFADYIKGLYVYGKKVIYPKKLIDVNLTYAEETTI